MTEQYLPPLSDAAKRWVRFGAVLASAVVLFWLTQSLADVLLPIVFALALAYVFNPVVNWFEKRGVERVSSITIGLIAILGLAAVLLTAGFVQMLTFVQQAPTYLEQTARWIDDAAPMLVKWNLLQPETLTPRPSPATLPATFPATAGVLSSVDDESAMNEPPPVVVAAPPRPSGVVRTMLADYLRRQGPNLAYAAYVQAPLALDRVTYWLTVLALIPMYTFFFLLRFDRALASVRDHLPADYRATIVHVVTMIDRSMSDFFRGRVVICLLVGLLSAVGWLIVGVPYSLPLGGLAGVLNLVPFLSVLVLPPALVLTYLESPDGGWMIPVGAAFGVFVIVQAIESFVLTPYIHGQSSGLHPVTTVVALLIGQAWAGALGMLLAIPVASALKLLAIEYVMPEVRRLAGHTPPPALPAPEAPAGGGAPSAEPKPTSAPPPGGSQ